MSILRFLNKQIVILPENVYPLSNNLFKCSNHLIEHEIKNILVKWFYAICKTRMLMVNNRAFFSLSFNFERLLLKPLFKLWISEIN
jgi:hypothetical protein